MKTLSVWLTVFLVVTVHQVEPAIGWQPGTIPAGQVSKELAASADVFPTIVKAAGGSLPKGRTIDGRDLLPLMKGETSKSPHEAVFAMGGDQLRLVRSGRWKLHVREPRPGFRRQFRAGQGGERRQHVAQGDRFL